jgi:hypothetical protein
MSALIAWTKLIILVGNVTASMFDKERTRFFRS